MSTATRPNRSTVDRLLQREMSVDKSKTLRRRVFDDWTRGWRLHWTTSDYADPYVTWENGSLARSTPAEERDRLRDDCLDEVVQVLTAAGYAIARETGCVRILGRVPA
ncbi:hypothetical protein [Nocardioides pakistanensis]